MSRLRNNKKWAAIFMDLFRRQESASGDLEASIGENETSASDYSGIKPPRWQEGFEDLLHELLLMIRDEKINALDEWLQSPERGRSRRSRSQSAQRGTNSSASKSDETDKESSLVLEPSFSIFDIDNENGSVQYIWQDVPNGEDDLFPESSIHPSLSPPMLSITRLEVDDTEDIKLTGKSTKDRVLIQARLRRRRYKEGEGVDDYLLPLYLARQQHSFMLQDNFNAKFQWRLRERFDIWRLRTMLESSRSNVFTIQILGNLGQRSWSQSASLHFHTIYVHEDDGPRLPEFSHFTVFIITHPADYSFLAQRRVIFEKQVHFSVKEDGYADGVSH